MALKTWADFASIHDLKLDTPGYRATLHYSVMQNVGEGIWDSLVTVLVALSLHRLRNSN